MKCIVCGKECNGKTCSGSCRAKLSRRTRTDDSARTEAHAPMIETPEGKYTLDQLPANYAQQDCQCAACVCNRGKAPKDRLIINHGPYKPLEQLRGNEINSVFVPGDVAYKGAFHQDKYGQWVN